MSSDFTVDMEEDITDAVCPVTFARAKAALDEMEEGQVLALRLNQGEAERNLPRSVKEEGHQALRLRDNGDGTSTLFIRKQGD
jgi:TusA-related sulfurtransferase